MSEVTIQEAKRTLSRELMQDTRVSGVGIEGDQIKVYLAEDDPDFTASIPSDVEGYPVTTEVIGRITPRADPAAVAEAPPDLSAVAPRLPWPLG